MEEAGSGLGLSMSVSNSYLIGQASLTTPTVSFWHPHPSITLSLMWVLCGPSLVRGLDLCVLHMWYSLFISPCPSVLSHVAVSPGSLMWLLCGPTFYPFTPHPCVLFVVFAVCFGLADISYIVVPCIWVCTVDGVFCSVCRNIPQHDGLLFDLLQLYTEWGVCVWSSTSEYEKAVGIYLKKNNLSVLTGTFWLLLVKKLLYFLTNSGLDYASVFGRGWPKVTLWCGHPKTQGVDLPKDISSGTVECSTRWTW